jgi:threonine/homoserine/homoserine lactone efflux protein
MKLFKVFWWGMLVSFLGSLPLGTLNIAAMQISVHTGVTSALYFSFGSLLVEMVYVRLSLIGMNWVRNQKVLFRWLEWITLGIVVLLAIGSFIAAVKKSDASNIMLDNDMHPFLLGLFMCAISPVQIPFWFGWSTVLFTKGILLPKNSHYNLYIVGIGLGTLMGNCVFIYGGQWIVDQLRANMNILNWIIGGIFTLTAIIQLIKILRHKDAAEKLEKLGEDTPTPIGSNITID